MKFSDFPLSKFDPRKGMSTVSSFFLSVFFFFLFKRHSFRPNLKQRYSHAILSNRILTAVNIKSIL